MPVRIRSSAFLTTRWTTPRSSKVNLPHAINFRALCGANSVTQHPEIRHLSGLAAREAFADTDQERRVGTRSSFQRTDRVVNIDLYYTDRVVNTDLYFTDRAVNIDLYYRDQLYLSGLAAGEAFAEADQERRIPHHTVDYAPFIKKSTCLTQLILGPYVVQIRSRNTPESGT